MEFKKYPKIYRLGVEETENILKGTVFVEEKIDGANTQIWIGEDGLIHTGSRSKELTEGFNGFCAYVHMNEPIEKMLTDHPDYRLYCEWLVRHTLQYNELAYRKAYLLDIAVHDLNTGEEKFVHSAEVRKIGESYGIPMPQLFAEMVDPTEEEIIKKYVGKTNLGTIGEGVVIKNPGFINKFGDIQYGKIVTQAFKEDNALVFGGNNKHSDTYWEIFIMNKYMTLERVQKIMHKIQPMIDEPLGLQHTPRIAGASYHDMMTEEIWEIAKKVGTIDFKALSRLVQKKAAQIYKEIITGDVSVAHTNPNGQEKQI